MKEPIDKMDLNIPDDILDKWQNIVNIMAEIIDVPAGLIMKVEGPYIEVLRSSQTEDNPCQVGDREHLAGLYCETVINEKDKLMVPNALKDEKWKDNPDVKQGMISYLGYPLLWPDGEPFGTICVLDSEENAYSKKAERLIRQFKEVIESHLSLLYQRQELKKEIEKRKEIEKTLKESEEKYKILAEHSADVIYKMNIENEEYTYVSPSVEKIFGYTPQEALSLKPKDVLTPKSYQKQLEAMQEELAQGGESTGTLELEAIHKDGHIFPVEVHASFILDEKGKPAEILGVARDITERKEAEEELLEERNKLEGLHKAVDQLQRCEKENNLWDQALQAAKNILELDLCVFYIVEGDKLVSKAVSTEALPEGLKIHSLEEGLAGRTLQSGETIQGEDLRSWEEAKPVREDIRAFISIPIGNIGVLQAFSTQRGAFSKQDVNLAEILVGHLREEVSRIRLEEDLKEQAIRDSLTGLFNRRHFNRSIEKEVERAGRYNHPLGFLMLDINRFKEINDRYSHLTGDKVLIEIANLLKRNVRGADTVVRYGGDEFLIILPETDGEADKIISRIRKQLDQWNQKQDILDFPLTLGIGSSYWDPESNRDVEDALKEADRKMYEDKSGR